MGGHNYTEVPLTSVDGHLGPELTKTRLGYFDIDLMIATYVASVFLGKVTKTYLDQRWATRRPPQTDLSDSRTDTPSFGNSVVHAG